MNIKYQKEHYEKAKAIVAKMTLEEKVSQLCSDAPSVEHLSIPAYHWWNEGLHGVARAATATVFPQAVGLAATFDKAVLRDVGEITAYEGRIKYNSAKKHGDHAIYKGITFWSPNINIYRDPRWGRGQETYGEDPVLTATCAENYIKAMQGGSDEKYMTAAACVKHMAAHSGPEGVRHGFNSEVSAFDLNDTYLPAFKWCVENADVEGVMGAYNMINGVHSCGNKPLMEDTLRGEWGFNGYFVSDCGALADMHMFCLVTHTAVESAALAIKSGCDLNCGQVYLSVLEAYNEGLVGIEDIDRSVTRLMATRSKLGMLGGCEYDKYTDIKQVESAEHLKKAYDAARKSAVMLKNDGILPLKSVKTVAVIGPNAVNQRALEGNYNGTATTYRYFPEAVKTAAGEDTDVLYSAGCHLYKDSGESCAEKYEGFSGAIAAAEASDVVIMCMGLDPSIEGEQGDACNEYGAGDKLSLGFPGTQQELMETIKKLGKPIILTVLAGGALDLSWADENCAAIIYGWYPGSQGAQAISDIIFGKANPSGKTPVTFVKSLDDIPDFEDYNMDGRTYRYSHKKPLYPFGFGLSYTDFRYEKPSVRKTDYGFEATVTLTNTGDMSGDCTAQVYAEYGKEKYKIPNCKLVGFESRYLLPKESKTITIELRNEAFLLTDADGKRYFPEQRIKLFIGGGQPKFTDGGCETEIQRR